MLKKGNVIYPEKDIVQIPIDIKLQDKKGNEITIVIQPPEIIEFPSIVTEFIRFLRKMKEAILS